MVSDFVTQYIKISKPQKCSSKGTNIQSSFGTGPCVWGFRFDSIKYQYVQNNANGKENGFTVYRHSYTLALGVPEGVLLKSKFMVNSVHYIK